MASSDRMTFNLSGTTFDVSTGTYEQLKHLSDKSKVLIEEAQKNSSANREIFLELDQACFAALLHFCHQGSLHLPTAICPQVFKDEMQCWGVELSQLNNCCCNTMVSFLDDCAAVRKFEEGLSHVKKKRGHPVPVTICQSIRVRVWNVLDSPTSSYLAKAYFAVFLVLLCLSLFSLIASTHPVFLRQMSQDEWMEVLGESYYNYEDFLNDRFNFLGKGRSSSISKRSIDQPFIQTSRDLPVLPEKKKKKKKKRSKVHPDSNQHIFQSDPETVDSNNGAENRSTPRIDPTGQSTEQSKSHGDTKENAIESPMDMPAADIRHLSEVVADGVEIQSDDSTDTTLYRKEAPAQFSANVRMKRAGSPKGQTTSTPGTTTPWLDTTSLSNQTSQTNQTNQTDVYDRHDDGDNIDNILNFRARLDFLYYVDYVCLAFFTMDFILRLLSCPRLSEFVRSVLNVSDLIALLADYAMVLVEILHPEEKYSLSSWDLIECLCIFRFVRFFRPLRDVIGFQVLVHSVKASTYELLLLVLFLTSGVMIFSTLLYWCERTNMVSIPDAFWWAIIIMTTVGYGDIYPTTFQGKVVGSLCALSGVVLIAITIPVLVNNFLLFYGFAKVIVARDRDWKEKKMKGRMQQSAHDVMERTGSNVSLVQVEPICKQLADPLSGSHAKVKVTSSTLKENC